MFETELFFAIFSRCRNLNDGNPRSAIEEAIHSVSTIPEPTVPREASILNKTHD